MTGFLRTAFAPALALAIGFAAPPFAYDAEQCVKQGEQHGWVFSASFLYSPGDGGGEGDQIFTYTTRSDFSGFYFQQTTNTTTGSQTFKLRGGEKLFNPGFVKSLTPKGSSYADIRVVFEDRDSDFEWETGGQVSAAGGRIATWLDNDKADAMRLQKHMRSKSAESTGILYQVTAYIADGKGGWKQTGSTPVNSLGLAVLDDTIDRVLAELDRDATIGACTDDF